MKGYCSLCKKNWSWRGLLEDCWRAFFSFCSLQIEIDSSLHDCWRWPKRVLPSIKHTCETGESLKPTNSLQNRLCKDRWHEERFVKTVGLKYSLNSNIVDSCEHWRPDFMEHRLKTVTSILHSSMKQDLRDKRFKKANNNPQWLSHCSTTDGVSSSQVIDEISFPNLLWERVRGGGHLEAPSSIAMRCLGWNCRGICNTSIVRVLKAQIRGHNPLAIFLCETKENEDRMKKVEMSIGFSNFFAVGPKGRLGGVCMVWSSAVDAEVLEFNSNALSIKDCTSIWSLIRFYGPPYRAKRRKVWENSHALVVSINGPWVCFRDFNEVINETEKEGSRRDGSLLQNSSWSFCSILAMWISKLASS